MHHLRVRRAVSFLLLFNQISSMRCFHILLSSLQLSTPLPRPWRSNPMLFFLLSFGRVVVIFKKKYIFILISVFGVDISVSLSVAGQFLRERLLVFQF